MVLLTSVSRAVSASTRSRVRVSLWLSSNWRSVCAASGSSRMARAIASGSASVPRALAIMPMAAPAAGVPSREPNSGAPLLTASFQFIAPPLATPTAGAVGARVDVSEGAIAPQAHAGVVCVQPGMYLVGMHAPHLNIGSSAKDMLAIGRTAHSAVVVGATASAGDRDGLAEVLADRFEDLQGL